MGCFRTSVPEAVIRTVATAVAYPSPVSLYTLRDAHDLIDPVLLAAFDGWVDAGSAATTALGILADDGGVVATFDADRLFDYRARRPPLEIVDGRLTELTWPELVLRRTRLEERDLLVLVGPEPDYHWRAFTADVIDLAGRLGVAQWISLGAIPAAVPHTRQVPDHRHRGGARPAARRRAWPGRPGRCACPPPSCLRSSSRSRRRASRRSGTSRRCRTTSPVRTPRLRWSFCGRSGTISVWRSRPASWPRKRASCATRLDTATGLDETTKGYVERLETMYDEQRLPSGDDLISDIERFLRDQGGTPRG